MGAAILTMVIQASKVSASSLRHIEAAVSFNCSMLLNVEWIQCSVYILQQYALYTHRLHDLLI